MARVTYGSFITSLKGSIGGITFHQNTSGNIARKKPAQLFKSTQLQSDSNVLFSQMRSAWSALTSAQQTLWNNFAALHTRTNYFGEVKTLTGYNWFMSINTNSLLCSGSIIPVPPAYSLPANPTAFLLIISATNIFIVFTASYSHSTLYTISYTTPPLRSESLRNRNKLRLTSVSVPGTSLAYNITTAFLAAIGQTSIPISPATNVKILSSLAAISNASFISSAFTSYTAEIPPNTAASITTGFNGAVRRIRVRSDGKYVCAGDFTTYNGTTRNRICVLNSDLSLYATFDPGNGFDGYVQDFCIDSDNKILVVGSFTHFQATGASYICRLTATGSLDSTFVYAAGFNQIGICVCPDGTGNYYIGGDFTTYKGATAKYCIKLNSVGTIDATFNMGTGFDGRVASIIRKAGSTMKLAGNFTHYNSVAINRIVAVSDLGVQDAGFVMGSGFNIAVSEMCFDSSTNIFVVGNFTTYNGAGAVRIIKLDAAGSPVASFVVGAGFDAIPYGLLLTFNDFILVGGTFTTYQGIPAYKIVRLRPDGSLDLSFIPYTSATSDVYSMAASSYNKLILCGLFTALGSITKNRICRVYADGTIN